MSLVKHPEYYAGQWLALSENHQIAGIGASADDARQIARTRWPKERLIVVLVGQQIPHILLPEWPLNQIRNLIPAGLSGKIWLVGGTVRDLLQHRFSEIHDWDFAVDGDALHLARDIADSLKGAYYPLDTTRGTARIIIKENDQHPACILDLAQIRGTSLNEDLCDRDFTVNAIAASLDGDIICLKDSLSDLAMGILRQVSAQSFQKDPARLLRAVRQANQHDYKIEAHTLDQLHVDSPLLRDVSVERVFSELNRLMNSPKAVCGWQQLHDYGLLEYSIPELLPLADIKQGYPHVYISAWQHTLATLAAMEYVLAIARDAPMPSIDRYPVFLRKHLPKARVLGPLRNILLPYAKALQQYIGTSLNADLTILHALKWSAILHDLGKATTRSIDARERVHFYRHDRIGADLTQTRLDALHVPKASSRFISLLVGQHMRFLGFDQHETMTRRMIHRYFRVTQDAGVALALLTLADTLGVRGDKLHDALWQRRLQQSEAVIRAWFDHQEDVIKPPPLLNGHEVISLGVPKGAQVGKALAALLEAQAALTIENKDQARAWIMKHWSQS